MVCESHIWQSEHVMERPAGVTWGGVPVVFRVCKNCSMAQESVALPLAVGAEFSEIVDKGLGLFDAWLSADIEEDEAACWINGWVAIDSERLEQLYGYKAEKDALEDYSRRLSEWTAIERSITILKKHKLIPESFNNPFPKPTHPNQQITYVTAAKIPENIDEAAQQLLEATQKVIEETIEVTAYT